MVAHYYRTESKYIHSLSAAKGQVTEGGESTQQVLEERAREQPQYKYHRAGPSPRLALPLGMAPPNKGSPPYFKYGSVDDSEQPGSSPDSFLPRASGCTGSIYGWEQYPSPQQQKKDLRESEAGRRGVSWRVVAAFLCSLGFLAGCGVWWSRNTAANRSTVVAAGDFFEIGAEAGVAAGEREKRPKTNGKGDPSDSAAATIETLEFTALNFYHIRDGKPGQDYPWLKDIKLIEPHRDTTLAVVRAREGFEYRWEVRAGGSSGTSGGAGEVQTTATGAVTIVVLTQLNENVVVLEEVDGDGKVTNRLEETVLVKYVRREIRSLTDDEKEELLDAVSTDYKENNTQSTRERERGRERERSSIVSIYLPGIT